ncbi:pantoate--beta-alanine ligase [Bdellovibrionota bacterium FG-2]
MKQPKLIKTVSELREVRRSISQDLGFVPTMGALHEGHASLMRKCVSENSLSVLSIFVNPTQFDNSEDLSRYPATLDTDLMLAGECGIDYVFAPTAQELYPDGYKFRVRETEFSKTLCGAFRPGHFEGVLSVVLKLLNIVQATRAYFGEKDYQQFQLIRDMAQAFFIPTQISPCPTIRNSDGLALSSRNRFLNPEQSAHAKHFPLLLASEFSPDEVKAALEMIGFKVDYIKNEGARRYGAVYLGNVRLIDNVAR